MPFAIVVIVGFTIHWVPHVTVPESDFATIAVARYFFIINEKLKAAIFLFLLFIN